MVTILLVEDDPDQTLLFSQALQMPGYTVETVADATAAQARLRAAPVTLLLADWDLPGAMQGDALIAWAKAHVPCIRSVLFSNHSRVTAVAAACGADAAIRKTERIISLRRLVAALAPLASGHA